MRIFLGYPSEHEATAWEVYEFLKSKGDEVWFDKESLLPGMDWDEEREKGQKEAQLVVHLYSKHIANRSGVVNREIALTLRLVEDQPLGSIYVISIRLDDSRLPLKLTRFQYLDFKDEWQDKLSKSLEKRRAELSNCTPYLPKCTIVEETTLNGSQKIEFKDTTESYECEGAYLRYKGSGPYWTYLNSMIASKALDGFFGTRYDFKILSKDNDISYNDLETRKHILSINTEEFFRLGDLLSIRFYTFSYSVGALHPNHRIATLNFFGEDVGSLQIGQLLGDSADNARKLISYCEEVISAQYEDELLSKDSFFENYKENDEQLWNLLGQFSFDKRGITFNFSPYDVLPFVFGEHEVLAPWRFLSEFISDDYEAIINKLST